MDKINNTDVVLMGCKVGLYVVLSCVDRGLCDGLVTCPKESYRVS
jgi:hypothetical protein